MVIYKNKSPLFKIKDKLESTYVPIVFLKRVHVANKEIFEKRRNTYPFWLSAKELFGKKQAWLSSYKIKDGGELDFWIPGFLVKVMTNEIFFPHILGDEAALPPLYFHGLVIQEFVVVETSHLLPATITERDAVELLVDREVFVCFKEDLVRAL